MTTPTPSKNDALSDPRIDAVWRAGSQEEPPAELDVAILAAARREVGAGPQSIGAREALAARRRWWPLAAAATVAAIAVGVLQLTPPDQLSAPASEKTVITDMPAPDKKLAPEVAKIVPREDAATILARDEVAKTKPRDEAEKDNATVDRATVRKEAAKDSATVDRATVRKEAAKDSATVERKAAREDVATDVRMADRMAPRQEMKEGATADRITSRADAPRAPSIVAAAPAPAKPETMARSEAVARNAASLPEPFPAAPPAPDTAAGAATSVAAAPPLAGKVAAPALAGGVATPVPPNEAQQVAPGAGSAFAGRMTLKGEAGGSAIVLVEPSQPVAPAAAAQSVPQSAAVRPSPQVTMAKARAAEKEADAERTNQVAKERAAESRAEAERTNEKAKDRDAVARTDRARTADRVQLPVAEWIALIRRLRDEGKVAEAAKELAAFRVAHVDHERLLPRDLVDWRPAAK